MELVIEVVSSEKHLMGSNAQHRFLPAGGVIGRSSQSDWVIPDQTRHMSGRHAVISYEAGHFCITDISTNGVYLNGGDVLAKNQPIPLSHGDQLLMGQIQFRVSVAQNDAAYDATSASQGAFKLSPQGSDQNPMKKLDQWAAQKTPQPQQPSSPMPDNVESQHEPFIPPAMIPTPGSAKAPSNSGQLPENWWEESAAPDQDDNVDASLLPGKSSIPPLPDWDEDNAMAHTVVAPTPSAHSPASSALAFKAFAEGLGVSVPDIEQAGGDAFLRRAGLLLRLCLRGMVSASQARASLKNEFRLDMTLVNVDGNNPIKFSATGDQAIKHLLSGDHGSFLPMDRAIEECFADVQEHQLAVMAGMQHAFAELMKTLSPPALEKRFDRSQGKGLSLGSKNARYWEAYRELHQDLMAEDDIFASLFSQPFAQGYDNQMDILTNSKPKKRD